MSEKKVPLASWKVLVILSYVWAGIPGLAAEKVDDQDKQVEETKHIHFPFVHIDVTRHKDGTKDVDVKAPFTKVHNPAGPNNADVKAPFTKINRTNNTVTDKKATLPPTKNAGSDKKQ